MKRALIGLTVLASGSAWGDSVTGEFDLGGKIFKPSHVAAFRVRDQGNARESSTYVMLTPAAVDADKIKNNLDPYSILINDEAADGDWIGLTVKADGKVTMNARMGGTQYVDTSGKIMGQQGSLTATCKTASAAQVQCDVSTAKPVKTMDGPTWQMKLSFDAMVQTGIAGKAMEKGGGAAGKALAAMAANLKAKNHAALLKSVAPDRVADFQEEWRTPEENQKEVLDYFDRTLPKKAKVVAAEQMPDGAVNLEIEGEPWEGTKLLYVLQLKEIEGSWRIVDTATLGMLK